MTPVHPSVPWERFEAMRRERDELIALVRLLEFAGIPDDRTDECPLCYSSRGRGHEPDCQVVDALPGAKVIERGSWHVEAGESPGCAVPLDVALAESLKLARGVMLREAAREVFGAPE